MKAKFSVLSVMALVGALLLLALPSYKGEDIKTNREHVTVDAWDVEAANLLGVAIAPGTGSSYMSPVIDTVTNTTNDTINIPYTLASPHTYSVHVTLSTLSGTRALKVYLDESNLLSGSTGWVAVDSVIPSTSVDEYVLDGTVYGRKQRLRLDGNAGATQSVRSSVTANYKLTYKAP